MAKLANPFVRDLLGSLESPEDLQIALDQATLIRDSLDDKEIQGFFANPNISLNDKRSLVKNNFADKVDLEFMVFLYAMIQQSHELTIVPVLSDFIKQVKKKMGILEAEVITAKPLSEAQKERIYQVLKEKSHLDIEIITSVDPNVIGGFRLIIDGQVFDSTIRSDLTKTVEHLKEGGHLRAESK